MKEYLTCMYAYAYGASLVKARRFTEEEKKHYVEGYKEKGFVGISKSIDLKELNWIDVREILNNRDDDGSFNGCGNCAYIVTEEEWNKLLELNNKRVAEKEKKERAGKIEYYKWAIAACEKQKKLYTNEEANEARRNYINVYNEGGEGFVPHFYTIDEYEEAKRELEVLEQSNG